MYIDSLNPDPNWCVIEDDFDISRVRHNESIMALGTGYLTIRSSFDEGFSDDEQNISYDRKAVNVSLEVVPSKKSRWGTFIPLVQGRHPFWNTGVINLPYMLGLELYADGEKLDMETCKITGYKRWLDMQTATLYRTFVWETTSGSTLNVLFRRYMNPDDRFLCVQEVFIRATGKSTEITARSYIDNDVRTNGYDKFIKHDTGFADDSVIYSDVTGNLGDRIVTVSRMAYTSVARDAHDACDACNYSETCDTCDTHNACDVQQVVGTQSHIPGGDVLYTASTQTLAREESEERRVSADLSFRLDAGEEARILKVSAQVASVYFDSDDLLSEGKKILTAAIGSGGDNLHAAHSAHWKKKWEDCDIKIETNDSGCYNSQLAIRQAIYHLLRARSGDPRALNCAKGSTSEMYLGSVCWDMEIFFQPFYIYMTPSLARMTGLYRYNILDGARRSATSMNYPGARYPWQTDRNGDEVCSLFEYADHEIHITADIVVGLWHYYLNTLDKDFLYDCGLEIILETSRYWVHRATKVAGRPGWHIFGVMGPDEYKPFTNNNAYTNFMVRENLKLAETVAAMCKNEAPEKYQKVCSKIGFCEDELGLFREVSNGLQIPKDDERHIIWQCDGFDTDFCEIDIEGLWKDKDKLFGFYTTQELRYRSKCLKQSDVIALMGLFTEAFTKEEIAASYDYYTPYTIHDSSNSISHNAIVAACIGRPEAAYDNWKKSIDIDFGLKPRSSEGIHFANVGGMWQEIVFGFCGMKSALNADILTFEPCMPKEMKSISFRMFWKTQKVAVTVTGSGVSITNMSDVTLPVDVCGQRATLAPGVAHLFPS